MMGARTSERRRAKRATVRLPVQLAIEGGLGESRELTSISASGAFVEGAMPEQGASISLSLSLPGGRFGLRGWVVRHQAGGPEGDAGFGVAFTTTPPSWRAIAHFLTSQPTHVHEVARPLETRDRVLLIAAIVRGELDHREAARRHGVSLVKVVEWERAIRRANELRRGG
jgi:hypothetical protein